MLCYIFINNLKDIKDPWDNKFNNLSSEFSFNSQQKIKYKLTNIKSLK